jgi:hypothetical protein
MGPLGSCIVFEIICSFDFDVGQSPKLQGSKCDVHCLQFYVIYPMDFCSKCLYSNFCDSSVQYSVCIPEPLEPTFHQLTVL